MQHPPRTMKPNRRDFRLRHPNRLDAATPGTDMPPLYSYNSSAGLVELPVSAAEPEPGTKDLYKVTVHNGSLTKPGSVVLEHVRLFWDFESVLSQILPGRGTDHALLSEHP